MGMFPVLQLTGFTAYLLALMLKIFTFATEQSQKISLNRDIDILKFAKLSQNYFTEIFISLASTNVI